MVIVDVNKAREEAAALCERVLSCKRLTFTPENAAWYRDRVAKFNEQELRHYLTFEPIMLEGLGG